MQVAGDVLSNSLFFEALMESVLKNEPDDAAQKGQNEGAKPPRLVKRRPYLQPKNRWFGVPKAIRVDGPDFKTVHTRIQIRVRRARVRARVQGFWIKTFELIFIRDLLGAVKIGTYKLET